MNKYLNQKIKLALGIISGRITNNNLDDENYYNLGYEPHNFSYYGPPDNNELLNKAEDIILENLIELNKERE